MLCGAADMMTMTTTTQNDAIQRDPLFVAYHLTASQFNHTPSDALQSSSSIYTTDSRNRVLLLLGGRKLSYWFMYKAFPFYRVTCRDDKT